MNDFDVKANGLRGPRLPPAADKAIQTMDVRELASLVSTVSPFHATPSGLQDLRTAVAQVMQKRAASVDGDVVKELVRALADAPFKHRVDRQNEMVFMRVNVAGVSVEIDCQQKSNGAPDLQITLKPSRETSEWAGRQHALTEPGEPVPPETLSGASARSFAKLVRDTLATSDALGTSGKALLAMLPRVDEAHGARAARALERVLEGASAARVAFFKHQLKHDTTRGPQVDLEAQTVRIDGKVQSGAYAQPYLRDFARAQQELLSERLHASRPADNS